MISVVIVDDHPIVRAGLRAVLYAAGDVMVVAEGASGAEALRLVAQHCPDVLVLDINLPDLNGIEVTRQLHAQRVTTAILMARSPILDFTLAITQTPYTMSCPGERSKLRDCARTTSSAV